MGRTTRIVTRVAVSGVIACAAAMGSTLWAQGGDRAQVAAALFTALDGNGDGTLTREETAAALAAWSTRWKAPDAAGLTSETLMAGLSQVLPGTGPQCGGRSANPRVPCPDDVTAMVAALPSRAPATPGAARKVLVFARAAGFVHSSIPLAARTIDEMGRKTGAWTTTISYDPADFTDATLASYDAIFLASTTGHFLDDPKDEAVTAARRAALLAFVRGGKGLAAIHAATDSYHASAAQLKASGPGGGDPMAARLASLGPGLMSAFPLAARMVGEGDANRDKVLDGGELTALAGAWFGKVDPSGTGRVTRADFVARYDTLMPPPPPRPVRPGNGQGPATELGPDDQVGTWPEFNRLLGGFFKFHWNDGQPITYRVEGPDHPLNAPFRGKTPFVVVDETYTFGLEMYSRANLRVLTSVDMSAMSAEDKAKEQHPRPDGDHPLSWIRAEGKGRVFYLSHGHNEKVYANTVLLEHLLAGMQYVLGDLPADATPSAR